MTWSVAYWPGAAATKPAEQLGGPTGFADPGDLGDPDPIKDPPGATDLDPGTGPGLPWPWPMVSSTSHATWLAACDRADNTAQWPDATAGLRAVAAAPPAVLPGPDVTLLPVACPTPAAPIGVADWPSGGSCEMRATASANSAARGMAVAPTGGVGVSHTTASRAGWAAAGVNVHGAGSSS